MKTMCYWSSGLREWLRVGGDLWPDGDVWIVIESRYEIERMMVTTYDDGFTYRCEKVP